MDREEMVDFLIDSDFRYIMECANGPELLDSYLGHGCRIQAGPMEAVPLPRADRTATRDPCVHLRRCVWSTVPTLLRLPYQWLEQSIPALLSAHRSDVQVIWNHIKPLPKEMPILANLNAGSANSVKNIDVDILIDRLPEDRRG